MSQNSGYAKRAYRHYLEDGFGEIALGLAAILFAGMILVIQEIDSLRGSTTGVVVLTAGIFFVGLVLLRFVINWLKARISYPRTGFVKMRRNSEKITAGRIVLGVALAPLGALLGLSLSVGLMVVFAALGINANLFLLGVMIALPAFVTGWHTEMLRFHVVGGIIFGASLVMTFIDLAGINSVLLLYVIAGLALIGSGGLTLAHFVRTNPPVNQEEA